MPNRNDVLKCPLCHGHGQVSRSEILDHFGDANKMEAYVTELRQAVPELRDRRQGPQVPTPGGKRKTDFEREVHVWNPATDLWTRSNKE